MLILTRNPHESIFINDDIKITILETSRSGMVRIGIAAPPNVSIYREEIYNKIKKERIEEEINGNKEEDFDESNMK